MRISFLFIFSYLCVHETVDDLPYLCVLRSYIIPMGIGDLYNLSKMLNWIRLFWVIAIGKGPLKRLIQFVKFCPMKEH